MGMCQLYRVNKARKDQGKCGRCRTAITAGSAYVWWKGRFGPRHVRHATPACLPEPYERESNPLRAEAMRGEDAHNRAKDQTSDAHDAAIYLREALGYAESIKDQLEDRVGNWQDTGLDATDQAEACRTSLANFEDYVCEAESVADNLEALPEPPTIYDYPESAYGKEEDPAQAADEDFDHATYAYEDAVTEVLDRLPEWPELDLGA